MVLRDVVDTGEMTMKEGDSKQGAFELSSSVKVELDILGSLSLMVCTVSVAVKLR